MHSWVFSGSKSFSGGYCVGPKFFVMGISWVETFSWVFAGSEFFSCEYFVGPTFFSGGLFRELKIFICWLHEQE